MTMFHFGRAKIDSVFCLVMSAISLMGSGRSSASAVSTTKLTKLIVSNSLIEVSVKMRCLVDDLKQKNILIEDGDKIKIYNSGRCADGNFKEKGFRFICNKIIHAESFNLDYIGKTTYHADMVWWSGEITLSGKYDGKNWEFFFSVIHWLDQVMNFINRTEKEITRLQGDSRDLQNHS